MNFNSVGISCAVSSWDLWGPALDNRVLSWTSRQGACPEDFPVSQLLELEEATETKWVEITGKEHRSQKLQQGH